VQSITPPWAGCSGLVHLNQSRGVVRLLHMYCPSLVFDQAANLPTASQNCRQHFQQTPWCILIVVVWVAVALQGRLMAHAQKLAQGSLLR